MLTLLRNGGYPPMLFILITGLVGLGAAFHFALRARRTSLGFIKSMSMATLFGVLAATCADVGATLAAAEKVLLPFPTPDNPRPGDVPGIPPPTKEESEALPRVIHIVIGGLAESSSPGILGFSFLALTWMLVAVGRRRLDERETS